MATAEQPIKPDYTAEEPIKPDFSRPARHFIFTDEHEQLRESIRRFVARELQPHAEEWEETTFPDQVFRRMGEQTAARDKTLADFEAYRSRSWWRRLVG